MSNKQVFQGLDLNNQNVSEVTALELLTDASNPSHATRLSQTQQVFMVSLQVTN